MENFNHKPKKEINLPHLLRFDRLTLKGVFFIVLALSLTQLYISNKFVTEGEKIKKTQLEVARLQAENLILKNQVQKLSSLKNLEEKAKELGFVKIEKVEYLDGTTTVASR